MSRLNKDAESERLQVHPMNKKVKYLPIAHMEMMLDQIFFGLWSTENFRWEKVGNEIVGCIEVKFYHPIARTWLTRSGAAGIQIMVDKWPFPEEYDAELGKYEAKVERNRWSLNVENKKPNALGDLGGFAHLKADCFKNAVLSIGRTFGRDVNREFTAEFESWVTDIEAKISQLRKDVEKALKDYQGDDKQLIVDDIIRTEAEGTNTPKFYTDILKKIGYELT